MVYSSPHTTLWVYCSFALQIGLHISWRGSHFDRKWKRGDKRRKSGGDGEGRRKQRERRGKDRREKVRKEGRKVRKKGREKNGGQLQLKKSTICDLDSKDWHLRICWYYFFSVHMMAYLLKSEEWFWVPLSLATEAAQRAPCSVTMMSYNHASVPHMTIACLWTSLVHRGVMMDLLSSCGWFIPSHGRSLSSYWSEPLLLVTHR